MLEGGGGQVRVFQPGGTPDKRSASCEQRCRREEEEEKGQVKYQEMKGQLTMNMQAVHSSSLCERGEVEVDEHLTGNLHNVRRHPDEAPPPPPLAGSTWEWFKTKG